ncbi:hypothetical protein VTN77DRAFT_7241 [Rasamsonia byssochlamydoides]|uniref:uncharacterized protein n=1 Tax=Rasamsonia byssochlamydoides TaxID=89139 RepID=UPI003742A45F
MLPFPLPPLHVPSSRDTGSSRMMAKRADSASLTVLLGVILGISVAFISCLLLAIYLNRRDPANPESSSGNKDSSSERLKRLDAVSPTCTLDQWWPSVRDSLSLSEAVDSQFICVVCLEPVLRTQVIHELKCFHVFHKECLEKWYLRNHFNCPLCHRAYFHEARRPVQDFVWIV